MVSRKSGRFMMQSGEITEDIYGESMAYSEDFESESNVNPVSGRQSGFHGSSVMEVSEAIPSASEYSDDFESQSQSQLGTLISGRKHDIQPGSSVASMISENIGSQYTEDYESES